MPETKAERILSYSTEDKAYPASNLLKVNAFYKWKCEEVGAKQAFVTFKVLLPSSSFMSPLDAKQGSGLNRVRIFGGDELTKSVAAQKWDVVKVVCTQPFNKTIQYGLSFIRFYHVSEEVPAEEEEKEKGAWFFKGLGGGNKVGEPSTSTAPAAGNTAPTTTDVLKPGGLFKMARQSSQEPPTTTLAQKLVEEKRTVTSPNSPAATGPPSPPQPRAPTSTRPAAKPAKPKEPAATSDDAPAAAAGRSESSAGPSSTSASRRPILSGVVVAFSGYQNPFRSELRTLCLRLGAKYCQDWTDQCTHLICAFPNTPKFRSVRGKGIIISHKWIQACNTAKKKVSWRPYRVGRAPSPVGHVSDDNDESQGGEEDSFSESEMIAGDEEDDWKPGNSDVGEDDDESDSMDSDASAETEEDVDSDDDDDDEDTDSGRRRKATTSKKVPSGRKRRTAGSPNHIRKRPAKPTTTAAGDDDVNRDWEPVRRKKKKTAGLGSTTPTNGGSTQIQLKQADEDEDTDSEINRKVENYMTATVNFVVSRASWCSDFDDALSASPTVVFVKPDWIYACDKTAKYVPYQRFQIVD